MKKSLIALAVAATAGAAFAQSSVTLYGVVDAGYTPEKKFTSGTGALVSKQVGVTDGGYAGSRIGFRGEEKLAGGISAQFVVEQGMSPTNGAIFGVRTGTAGLQYDGLATSSNQWDAATAGAYTQATNRQSYVGLTGGFGTVRVGYHYTNVYEVSTLSGFTMTSEGVQGGQNAHLWGQAAAGGTRANGITYMSPRMSGLMVAVQWGSAGGRENTEWNAANTATGTTQDKQERRSIRIDYLQGPLRAAYSWTSFDAAVGARGDNGVCPEQVINGTAITGTVTNQCVNTFNVYGALTSVGASPLTATAFKTTLNQLAASYDLKVVKLGATINKGTKDTTVAATPTFNTAAGAPSAAGTTAVGSFDFGSQAISFNAPLGKFNVTGGFGKADLKSAGSTLIDIKQQQLGLLYNLSPRTIAYGYVGSYENSSVTSATSARKGQQSIVGLYHAF